MGAGACSCCGIRVREMFTVAVVVISEGAKRTFFILIDDNVLLLLRDESLFPDLCFAASRCLCCHTEYSPKVVALRTPWLRLQFVKQYPLLCQRGQQRFEDPFMSGGGSSVQIFRGKIAL